MRFLHKVLSVGVLVAVIHVSASSAIIADFVIHNAHSATASIFGS